MGHLKTDQDWDIPDEYLAEIGRVTVRWNRLESLMDLCLIELLGKSMLEGRSLVLFTHMAFPQKMDIMGALIIECLTNPTYGWLSRYKQDVAPLLGDAAKKRNMVIHSKWSSDPDGTVGRSEISARGKLKMERHQASLKEIEAASASIVRAADAMVKLVLRNSLTPQQGQ